MSGVNFSDLESFGNLKEMYAEDAQYQDHVSNSIWSFIREAGKSEVNFDGNYWNIQTNFTLNESYAALNDNEHLPESDFPKGVFAKYRPKLMYSTIEATTFAATRGERGGRPTGKYLDDQIKSTFMSMLSNIDFDAYGNGRGYRGTISTASAGAASFVPTSSMMLRAGMKLDWYDSTYATKRGTIKVAAKGVDRMNKTVYVDTSYGTGVVPVSATAGDILVVAGALNPNEPADGRHIGGLARLTDNTLSIGSLAPSTWALWQSPNLNASGANPSQSFLQQHIDAFGIVSGLLAQKMVINPAWKRAYLEQFLNQRRFNTNSFDTGASTVSFTPVKMGTNEKGMKKPQRLDILEDRTCPADSYFLWNDQAFCKAPVSNYGEPHLADEDGREMRMRLGYDSMQGFLRAWTNTVVSQRNALCRGYGFATPTGAL
jgi:hypothetical protein